MTLNLISLIRAGYNREAPGQGFRAYAPGSPVTGTKLSDYVIGAMSITGPLINTLQPEFDVITSGTPFTLTASFASVGAKFPTIRTNTVNALPGWYFYCQGSGSQQVQIVITSVTWGALSATIGITVNGIYPDVAPTLNSFAATVDGTVDRFGVTYTNITFLPVFNTVDPATGFSDTNMYFKYIADVGEFNTVKQQGPYNRRVAKQSYPPGYLMYEWTFFSTNTIDPNVTPEAAPVSSSYELAPYQTATVYAWYRRLPAYEENRAWIPYTVPAGGLVPIAVTYTAGGGV